MNATHTTVPYHCLISVQTRGGAFLTAERVLNVDESHPDVTRGALVKLMRAEAAEQVGHSDFVVLFFSAEPNRLGR
ncbi:hypothetical protein [Streptomyces sp. NPDC087511]|uniref:hypothetical protein n=1 Tax=Streptomyces sp. NPDC087511 TaxID=3365792 RepID=UPI0038086C29